MTAASGTDAGNVAHHAVVTKGRVGEGMKVGIIGIGGLGQFGARIAVLKGAEVFAAEVKESSWEFAKELGVKRVVKDVTELSDEQLDVIIDFAGFGTTTTGAIDAVRPGGRVVQVGMGKVQFEFNSIGLITKEVEYVGSVGGGTEDLAGVWELMASGGLKPAIEVVRFDDIAKGLDELHRGNITGRAVANLEL